MNRRIGILGVGLLCLAPLPAHGQGRPLSYDDYYRIETASATVLSPDGSRVAFVRSRRLEEENRTHREVWVVAADGSEDPLRLTSSATEAWNPRWSPDGRLLAFSSTRRPASMDGPESVWFLPMDRPGEAVQLEGVGGFPVFDPTDRWIAFTRPVSPELAPEREPDRTEPGADLTEEERKIVERFDGRAYDWMQFRFDGRGYLPDPTDPRATPPSQLFVLPRSGGEGRQLTHLTVDASGVAWHPGGGSLVFVADEHQRDELSYPRADLWTVDLQGTVHRVTDDEYDWDDPAWSPDGGRLVAVGTVGLDVVIRERWDHGSPVDIWLLSADGRERRNLTEDFDLIPGAPTWSPDGEAVFFTAGIGGDVHLFRLDVATGEAVQVTSDAGRVGSVSFSADGSRMAYTREDATHPAEVFVGRVGGAATRLTALNAGLLGDLALQEPRRLLFESPDGTEIEGWVLPPVGWTEEDERSWPMLLNIHGGPHGAYGNRFSFDFHLQSSRGYFVLYTNPRASTGYGEEFRWATWGSWGDEDYDDVMAGVDAVVARFPVDEERMGVTGYSYGGFLTNWIITQTDRFAAAVSGAGISNWVSDYAVADIPRTKETEFYGPPWEEDGLRNLLAASPVIHAAGVSTPTLFVHGESDHRVPIEEAEQMYVALKKQAVPAKMIRYPDSSHGGWTPWRYLHRLYAAQEWWEAWLGETPIS
ncbi:MAG: S9 family peptidase [Longimicrobiales bacterium]|nr:S9 family peptidase [Longimicrobiales bacterium]